MEAATEAAEEAVVRYQQCIDTNLFGQVCDYCDGGAIFKVVSEVIKFATAGITVVAIAMIIFAGIMYMTSADNVARQTKARRAIIDILIGLVVYAFMFTIANFLIPGGIVDSTLTNETSSCPKTSELPGGGEDPPGGSEPGAACGSGGLTVSHNGYCFAKTQIMAYDYVADDPCRKHNTCQKNTPAWNSSCSTVSSMNAGEMITGIHAGWHDRLVSTGAHYSDVVYPIRRDADNNPKMLCNGSLSRPTSDPGSPAINRIDFKSMAIEIVEHLYQGKLVGIAIGARTRGSTSESRTRHFVTIVGVSDFVTTGNIKNATVEYESGDCIGEPYDQPVITVDGKQVKFAYVDPWGATMNYTNTKGGRIWRYNYDKRNPGYVIYWYK